ncbi:hypothetical protein ACLM45_03295 [Synechococcus sp. A10-1-5-9]
MRLETSYREVWPVISLEPSLQAWMTTVKASTLVRLRGLRIP